MLSWMPSFSRIGTSSSIERNQAASQASVKAPAQQEQWLGTSGEGPRPNSEFMVSQPISTATWIAAFQLADRGLPLALDRARPAVHRQQRRELDAGILERPLELLDPLRIDARAHPPVEEVGAWRQLDILVAELGHESRQLKQRHVAVHVGIESDLHDRAPSVGDGRGRIGAAGARGGIGPRRRIRAQAFLRWRWRYWSATTAATMMMPLTISW